MTDCILNQERDNSIKRINQILNKFEVTLKIAENLYNVAVKEGNILIQKEIQKRIKEIKKEKDYINSIIIRLENI